VDQKYDQPLKSDMAICFVYFNSMKSKRLLMNYLYTVEKLKNANIKFFTLELFFDVPEIHDAIHLRGTSAMFHKEQLCHILETYIPRWYTKLMFLDADIVFEEKDWYTQVSKLLDENEIVQPFESCVWLDLTYTREELVRQSVVKQKHFGYYNLNYHPGFAWAFQRQWFRAYGFFRYAVTGSGDTLSSAAWFGQKFPASYFFPKALELAYDEYKNKIKNSGPTGPRGLSGFLTSSCGPLGLAGLCLPAAEEEELKFNGPRVEFCPGRIFHLHHGSRKNRKYSDRHHFLDGIADIRKVIKKSYSGVFSFTMQSLNDIMKNYFLERLDDE